MAKGAGSSRPTFYFYFRSKNAALLSLPDQVNSRANAALKALSGDPEEHVTDTAAHVWLASIYDVRRWPPHVRPAGPTAVGNQR